MFVALDVSKANSWEGKWARESRQAAGAGGYHNLHSVAKVSGVKPKPPVNLQLAGDTVTLESFVDDHHGFLRLEVGRDAISGKYFTVPRPQDKWSQPPNLVDTFRLNTKTHKMI